MALDDEETLDRFRTLDSGAIADGAFRDAYVCRSMARGATYLAKKGHPLLHLLYSAQSVVGEGNVRAQLLPVHPTYQRLVPGGLWLRPKKAGLNRATLRLMMQATEDTVIQVQVTTLRSPLQPDLRQDSGRVLEIVGTGAREVYELENIPIDEGPMERIGFFVRSLPTDLVGSIALHTVGGAGTNAGRVAAMTMSGFLRAVNPPANLWRLSSSTADSWATDHVVVVHDGPNAATVGNPLFQRQIINVDTADSFQFWPPPAGPYDVLRLLDRYFAIYELSVLRVFGLAMHANDRA